MIHAYTGARQACKHGKIIIVYKIRDSSRRGMRAPHVYGSASDLYTWKNNYLNNTEPEVGRV